MSLRAYAAIKLGVPDSGIDWLDDMICKSVRELFAGQALAGLLAGNWEVPADKAGRYAYEIADAMLKARVA